MRTLITLLLCFSPMTLLILIRHFKRRYQIKNWYKALSISQHEDAFNHLYQGVNGFALSKQARLEKDAFEYTYGEIDFVSFIALVSLTRPDKNTRFYDLGSGTGKAVIACAMVYPMQTYCGVELFEALYTSSLKQKKHFARLPEYEQHAKAVSFVHDNFLDIDLGGATLIYINSTALIGETWQALNLHLVESAVGATIITISKKLTSAVFKLLHTTEVKMSWGIATAYIQVHQGH